MKSLTEYILEQGEGEAIAPSVGAQNDASNMATPGNTMGMGDPKMPTPEEPGSGDLFGKTRKEKKKKKCTKDEEERD